MLQDAKGRVSKPVRCSAPGQAQQMLIYTAHAQRRMALRQIERLWLEVTINQPERSEPDPRDPALTRAWRRSATASCGLFQRFVAPGQAAAAASETHRIAFDERTIEAEASDISGLDENGDE